MWTACSLAVALEDVWLLNCICTHWVQVSTILLWDSVSCICLLFLNHVGSSCCSRYQLQHDMIMVSCPIESLALVKNVGSLHNATQCTKCEQSFMIGIFPISVDCVNKNEWLACAVHKSKKCFNIQSAREMWTKADHTFTKHWILCVTTRV